MPACGHVDKIEKVVHDLSGRCYVYSFLQIVQ